MQKALLTSDKTDWISIKITKFLKIRILSSRFEKSFKISFPPIGIVNFKDKIKENMLCKIFILKFLFLNAETKSIIKATEKNFPSFVSLTDGKEALNNNFLQRRLPDLQRHLWAYPITYR